MESVEFLADTKRQFSQIETVDETTGIQQDEGLNMDGLTRTRPTRGTTGLHYMNFSATLPSDFSI